MRWVRKVFGVIAAILGMVIVSPMVMAIMLMVIVLARLAEVVVLHYLNNPYSIRMRVANQVSNSLSTAAGYMIGLNLKLLRWVLSKVGFPTEVLKN